MAQGLRRRAAGRLPKPFITWAAPGGVSDGRAVRRFPGRGGGKSALRPAFPGRADFAGEGSRAGPAAGAGRVQDGFAGQALTLPCTSDAPARKRTASARSVHGWYACTSDAHAQKEEPRQKRGWWAKKLFIRDGVRPSPGLFSYKRRGRRDTPYGAYRRAPAPAGPVQSAPAPRAVRAPGPVGVWRRTACFPIRRLFGRRGFFRLAFVRGQFTLAAYFCRTLSICCVCAVSMGYQPFSDILL